MPNLNLVISTFGLKTANCLEDVGGFIFYSLSFFFRKESNAITVLATVATQVTTAITNSKVITSLPIQLFQQKPIRVGSRERRLKAGKLRVTQQFQRVSVEPLRNRSLKLGISNNQSMTQFNQNVYNFVKYYYIQLILSFAKTQAKLLTH